MMMSQTRQFRCLICTIEVFAQFLTLCPAAARWRRGATMFFLQLPSYYIFTKTLIYRVNINISRFAAIGQFCV